MRLNLIVSTLASTLTLGLLAGGCDRNSDELIARGASSPCPDGGNKCTCDSEKTCGWLAKACMDADWDWDGRTCELPPLMTSAELPQEVLDLADQQGIEFDNDSLWEITTLEDGSISVKLVDSDADVIILPNLQVAD